MVPAALMRLDIANSSTEQRLPWCDPAAPKFRRAIIPAWCSASFMAELAWPRQGHHRPSPGIADFGAWLEQLLAEFTGKHGQGARFPSMSSRSGRRTCTARPRVRLPAAGRRSPTRAGRRRRRARTGRTSDRAYRRRRSIQHLARILPLGNRDSGRRRDPRNQSVQPAGRGGQQEQDARTHCRLREKRRTASRIAAVLRPAARSTLLR